MCSITDEGQAKPLQDAPCLDDWKSVPILVRWRLERWVFIGLIGIMSAGIAVLGLGIALLTGRTKGKTKKTKTQ